MHKDPASPLSAAFPLRRSPLFWIGLLGASFLGSAWFDSRSQYSGMRALGPAASSLVVYSAESAVRLRMIWWDDRLDFSKWNRINFFRAAASSFRWTMPTVAHPEVSPGAFPGRAWERNDGVTTLYPDPDTGGMVHVRPSSARYTAMRFDLVSDSYSAYFPASDHYARLDIVAPYWFLLMLYVPAWLALLLGLRAWRRRKMSMMQAPERSGISSLPVAS